jgi:molecular chaperone GrpE
MNKRTDKPDAAPSEGTATPEDAGDETAQPAEGASPVTGEDSNTLKEQAAKARDQLLRTAAEFDNFKKRVARERQEASRYANESLLRKLIPVLDSFDMALAATNKAPDKAIQSLQAGIVMIYQQLKSALAEVGLQEMDATGKPFDPAWHEAVSEQASADVAEGHVLQQLRKGYKLHDRLLRPAGVVVARKPGDASARNTSNEATD